MSRFRIACRMLRNSGRLGGLYSDQQLPGQRKGESPIDWLVRLGLASDPATGAEMLIMGAGLTTVLNDLEVLLEELQVDL